MVQKTGGLRNVDQKYPESYGMWCWRRTDKISWTDSVRNEEMLQRDKEEWNILQTVNRRKVNTLLNYDTKQLPV